MYLTYLQLFPSLPATTTALLPDVAFLSTLPPPFKKEGNCRAQTLPPAIHVTIVDGSL